MMSERFTVEEVNLICAFNTKSRSELISALTAAMPDFDEPEMAELAETVIGRLSAMTDEGFAALELCPEYEEQEE